MCPCDPQMHIYSMENLFKTLDYRDYLKSVYESKKSGNRYYSYKVFAEAIGMDQSHLAKVLMKHMHLASERVPQIIRYLGLKGMKAEYFESLVQFGRATNANEAKLWYDKLQSITPPRYKVLSKEQFEYFDKWYTPVIRSIIGLRDHWTADEIAELVVPSIDESQVKESINTLIHNGMVKQEGDKWLISDPHLGSGSSTQSSILREYHRSVLDVAKNALDHIPVEERDVSSLVVALDDKAFEDIKVLTKQFRMSIQKRIDQIECANRICHPNLLAHHHF